MIYSCKTFWAKIIQSVEYRDSGFPLKSYSED